MLNYTLSPEKKYFAAVIKQLQLGIFQILKAGSKFR